MPQSEVIRAILLEDSPCCGGAPAPGARSDQGHRVGAESIFAAWTMGGPHQALEVDLALVALAQPAARGVGVRCLAQRIFKRAHQSTHKAFKDAVRCSLRRLITTHGSEIP